MRACPTVQTRFSELIVVEHAQKWREKWGKYSEIVFTSTLTTQLSPLIEHIHFFAGFMFQRDWLLSLDNRAVQKSLRTAMNVQYMH